MGIFQGGEQLGEVERISAVEILVDNVRGGEFREVPPVWGGV